MPLPPNKYRPVDYSRAALENVRAFSEMLAVRPESCGIATSAVKAMRESGDFWRKRGAPDTEQVYLEGARQADALHTQTALVHSEACYTQKPAI